MKTPYPLLVCILFCFAPGISAKPVSYVGGTAVRQENDETGYALSVEYTFHPRFALASYSKYEIGGDEFWTTGLQLNTLLKRWNLPDGQGNIFALSGAGLAQQGDRNEPAAWLSLMGDYESRRWYFSYEARVQSARNIENSFSQHATAGFAPYLANYEQLNTWLLLRFNHHPAEPDHFVVTPFIRFFYKTIWLEAGYSSNNEVMVNWTVQF